MSVDVSPDGRKVVFDLLGDLYTLPLEGGTATAISRGPAYDHHPRFSPDGATIAFTSDEGGMENLWLASADGTNRRPLTTEKTAYVRSAAWLPDGDYLVARHEEGKRAGLPPNELWLYHRLGGSGVKLTVASDLNAATGPVASRDGRFIYYAARRARFCTSPIFAAGLWSIVRYDRSTNERTTLTSGIGGAVRPAISPDGKTLVYVSRRDAGTVLVARTLDTGAERVLVRGLTHDDQEGFAALDVWPNYAFTPDGQSLVYSSKGGLHRLALAADATPQPIPFTAPVSLALAPTVTRQDRLPQGPVESKILRRAQQSPDGRAIVFEAFGRVWVQALEGGRAAGAPRRLTATETPSREYTPAISPDGQSVAFVSWSDAEGGAVWKAALAATRVHADAPDHGRRALRQPVVVPQRRSPGRCARVGTRVPWAAAGRGELLRASLAAVERRRAGVGDHRRAAGRHPLPPGDVVEQRRHAVGLRPRRRAQDPRRRPEGRSCVDPARWHRQEDAAAPAAGGRPGALARRTLAGFHGARSGLRHRRAAHAARAGARSWHEGSQRAGVAAVGYRGQLRGVGRRGPDADVDARTGVPPRVAGGCHRVCRRACAQGAREGGRGAEDSCGRRKSPRPTSHESLRPSRSASR